MEYHEHQIVAAVSICPPPPTMRVILAWKNREGERDHSFLPVVALRATVRNIYARPMRGEVDKMPDLAPHHSELVRCGFKYLRTEEHLEAMVISPEHAFMVPSDELDGCLNEQTQVIVDPLAVGELDKILTNLWATIDHKLDARAREEAA